MATRYIEKESKKVSDLVNFKWKIRNLTVDDLPTDESRLASPSFKCFNAVFCLEIARTSDDVYLYLTQSNNVNPPWISDCTLGLTYSDKCDQYFKQFTTPTIPADITCSFAASAIKTDSADSVLNVFCNFTASALVQVFDDESETAPEEHEREVNKSGAEWNESEMESDESEISSDDPDIQLDESEIELDASDIESSECEEEPDESDEDVQPFYPGFALAGKIKNNLGNDIEKALKHCSFSDVTLKVGEDEFQAHKVILASRSKVFQAMFESDMKESRQNVVHILEMKPSIAKDMLMYIYTGKIENLSMDRALDLYVAADRYDLRYLKKLCQHFIQEYISTKYVCQVAELAYLHGDKKLAKTARRIFRRNSKRILVLKYWLDFAKKKPHIYSKLMKECRLNES